MFANSSLILRWMRASVDMSTAEVASSRSSRRGRERMARARQRSCFWPWLRLAPELEMGEERSRKMFVLPLRSPSLVPVVAIAVVLLLLELDSTGVDSGAGMGVELMDGTRWTRERASLTW